MGAPHTLTHTRTHKCAHAPTCRHLRTRTRTRTPARRAGRSGGRVSSRDDNNPSPPRGSARVGSLLTRKSPCPTPADSTCASGLFFFPADSSSRQLWTEVIGCSPHSPQHETKDQRPGRAGANRRGPTRRGRTRTPPGRPRSHSAPANHKNNPVRPRWARPWL